MHTDAGLFNGGLARRAQGGFASQSNHTSPPCSTPSRFPATSKPPLDICQSALSLRRGKSPCFFDFNSVRNFRAAARATDESLGVHGTTPLPSSCSHEARLQMTTTSDQQTPIAHKLEQSRDPAYPPSSPRPVDRDTRLDADCRLLCM